VWPPGSADTVCPRRPLMTHVQHWDKTAKTDHVTLTFDLGCHGACSWCGSSSIRVPSLKFGGLAVRKVWRTMCVKINGPGDLETGKRVASKVGNPRSEFGHARPSGSPVIRYVRDGRTDGQTQTSLPPSYGRGHNKLRNWTSELSIGYNSMWKKRVVYSGSLPIYHSPPEIW